MTDAPFADARGRLAIEAGKLSPLAATRSATTVAAECLGWDDGVGSLRPGRFADVVAVDGDPLADVRVIERPVMVLKGGRVALDRRPATA